MIETMYDFPTELCAIHISCTVELELQSNAGSTFWPGNTIAQALFKLGDT